MLNNACSHRYKCDNYNLYGSCDGCAEMYSTFWKLVTNDGKPKKKLVLVGKSNGRRAHTFMDLVTDLLSRGTEPVDIVRIDWTKLIFETPHVEVRFFLKDHNPDRLLGLYADAIFGEEYPELLSRAKPGAIIASEYGGSLTSYIRWIEQEATECKKMYITTASGNSEWYKRFINSVYGAHPENRFFVDLNGSQPSKVEFLWGRQNGKTQACAEYMRKLIEKGEFNMPTEAAIYVRQDINSLAAAFKRVNDAFNRKLPGIKTVHFSGPCTVVIWEDKTKTIVRCKDNDMIDYEKGLAMAIAKKALGTNKSGSNYYDIFKKWLPKEEEPMILDWDDVAITESDATCQG